MSKTVAMLVIVVSGHGCKLDNVDRAEVHQIPMSTVEECEKVAAALNSRVGVRAFCDA